MITGGEVVLRMILHPGQDQTLVHPPSVVTDRKRAFAVARIRLAKNSAVWHLVCQKQDCQGKRMCRNSENNVALTSWHLVCQK